MKSLGIRGTIAIGAVMCLAVLVAGWFLLVQPVKADISKTKADTATQQQDNDALQAKVATMRGIAKQLPAEQAELATLTQRVPDSVELAALLRSIQGLADDTGVSLDGFAPTAPAALPEAPGISTVSVALNVKGGYAELEQFDTELEALQRTFLVSGFTMTGAGVATDSSATQITAAFTGRVLVHTPATATAATTVTPSATSTTSH